MGNTDQISTVLTDEQRKQFDRDGYLRFDPEIPAEVLDQVRRDVEGKFSFEGDEETDEFGVRYTPGPNPRITYAWKISEAIKQVALAPKVLAVLQELFGRKPLPFQTLNFMNGTEQPAHVDGMYFNSDPTGYMCGVWAALEDIDMDNGPLIYYPGSHKLPLPTWEEMGDADRSAFDQYADFLEERVTRYQRHVDKQVEGYGREAEYGTIPKGQALVWAAHLIHGGSPQRDRNRTRHSQVTHYYFEGGDLLHWWPLRKEGDRKYRDYPGWIRSDTPKVITASVVQETIEAHVPAGETAAVLTGGDEEMLELEGRSGRHFPQRDGHAVTFDQVTGQEAVEQVEQLREEGARYLVIPGSRAFLLGGHFADLQRLLEERYRPVLRDGNTCVIYALD